MRLPDTTLRLLASVTVIWALVFALAHFCWAAGSEIAGYAADEDGLSTRAALYIAGVALVGLLGAAVAYGFQRSGNGRLASRWLRRAARLGAVALLLGVALGSARWAVDGSLGDDGAGGVFITLYFLVGGLLYALLGWSRGNPHESAMRLNAKGSGARRPT